jgi:hypothetical protein
MVGEKPLWLGQVGLGQELDWVRLPWLQLINLPYLPWLPWLPPLTWLPIALVTTLTMNILADTP